MFLRISKGRFREDRLRLRRQTSSSMPEARAGGASPENLHVLILSSNRKTIADLRGALTAAGYRLRASPDIAAGIRHFRLTNPDLLVIDTRLLENRVPEDVVRRFHVWRRHGDHYHPHGPIVPSATHVSGSGVSTIGKLTLDPRTLTVHIDDRVSSLTETEFAILVLLMSHRGKAMTRDELLDAVKHEGIPFERVIDRQICNIRHKIDVTPNSPSIIETVRGIGYRIDR